MMAARHDRPDHAAELAADMAARGPFWFCTALGLRFKREGNKARLCCPFHSERTASAVLEHGSQGTLRLTCFGACGRSWNAHGVIGQVQGLDTRTSFPQVLAEGARLLGRWDVLDQIEGRSSGSTAKPLPRPVLPPPPPPESAVVDAETFRAVAMALLEACPLAGSVGVGLASRGILAEATADGWAELPRNTHKAGEERARDAAAGFDVDDPAADELVALLRGRFDARSLCWVLDRSGGLANPAHRLLVPWRTPTGELWGLQRRWAPTFGDETPPEEPAKVSKYLWPSRKLYSPQEVFPYGIDSPDLASAAEVWVVEGATDALALRALNRAGLLGRDGVRSMAALGIPGVQAWGAYAPRLLEQVRGRRVLVALDGDKAGRSAVEAIGADAWRAGSRDVGDVRPPGAKDWGELASRLLWQER